MNKQQLSTFINRLSITFFRLLSPTSFRLVLVLVVLAFTLAALLVPAASTLADGIGSGGGSCCAVAVHLP